MACNEFKMNKGCALEEQITWHVRYAAYLSSTVMNYSIHFLLYGHIHFYNLFRTYSQSTGSATVSAMMWVMFLELVLLSGL